MLSVLFSIVKRYALHIDCLWIILKFSSKVVVVVEGLNKLLMYNDKEYTNGENVDVLQEKENVISYSQIKGCKTKVQ